MVNWPTSSNKTNNNISHQIVEHKNTTTYDVGNLGPGLGQAHMFGSGCDYSYSHSVVALHFAFN